MNPNSATRPVVAPALGIMPMSSPYNVPARIAAKISITSSSGPTQHTFLLIVQPVYRALIIF